MRLPILVALGCLAAAAHADEFDDALMDAGEVFAWPIQGSVTYRLEAAEDMAVLGEDAAVATGVIAQSVLEAEGKDRMLFAKSLWRIGEMPGPYVPRLAKLLDDPFENQSTRRYLTATFARMGRKGSGAASALRKALRNENEVHRVEMAVALWRVTGRTKRSLEILARELQADPPNFDAIPALGEMGSAAEPLRARILEALGDRPLDTTAVRALWRIDGDSVAALIAIRPAVEAGSDEALRLLAEIGLEAKPLLPTVLGLLREGRGVPGGLAVLESFGEDTKEVRDVLRKLMESPPDSVAQRAALAYHRLTGDTATALVVLIRVIERRKALHKDVLHEAVRSLAEVAPRHDRTKRVLEELAEHGRTRETSFVALQALRRTRR